jgi:energy-coupling factor transport system substrate-specific component
MSSQAWCAVLVAVAAVAGMLWYERRRPPAKLVAVVAALAALAVAARVLLAPVPNVQGTTDVALLSGYVLGPAPGFMVGALAALASNLFLGQGPWTPWQMVGWGAAGAGGALLATVAGRRLGRWPLAIACAAAGLAFGAWMDLFTLTTFAADSSTDSYLAIAGVSLPFNIAHAAGNGALCLVLGPSFVRVLERFRRRLEVRWVPLEPRRAPVGRVGAASLCVAVAIVLATSTAAPAAGSVGDGLRYLQRAQNRDGGFGGGPRQSSSQLITGWTVLGLEAAGRHPLDLRRAGRTPIDYMRAGVGTLRDTGELERTILALRGAGLSVRRFGGRDLLRDLLRKRRPEGSFEGLSNWTAFGIMSLRAAGRSARSPAVRRSGAWLARQQNTDGGFSYATGGGASFVDETGAALQGLAAADRAEGRETARAVSYLRGAQNPDGGFGQTEGYRSNAQSTAWAVQGIVAAGRAPGSFRRGGRSPLAYLASLQQDDGSFRYSRSSAQTPVWVTAQVVTALRRKPFPLDEPARRRRAAADAGAPGAHRDTAAVAGRRAASGREGRPRAGARPAPAHRGAAQPVRRAPVATRPVASRSEPGASEEDSAAAPVATAGAAALALAVGGLWLRRRRRA